MKSLFNIFYTSLSISAKNFFKLAFLPGFPAIQNNYFVVLWQNTYFLLGFILFLLFLIMFKYKVPIKHCVPLVIITIFLWVLFFSDQKDFLNLEVFYYMPIYYFLFFFTIAFLVYLIIILVPKFIREFYSITKIFLFFIILCMFFFLFPVLMLIFSFLLSVFTFMFVYQTNYIIYFVKQKLQVDLYSFLFNSNIRSFLSRFYVVIFERLTNIEFFLFTNIVSVGFLMYLGIAKIIVFLTIINKFSNFAYFDRLIILALLFCCLHFWFLRLLTHLALLVHTNAFPLNHSLLLISDSSHDTEVDPPDRSNSTQKPIVRRIINIFPISRPVTRVINHYTYARPKFWYSYHYITGICALGVGCVGAYVGYLNYQAQNHANIIQADANKIQAETNLEATRLNDLYELDAGIITKEDYINKWKK